MEQKELKGKTQSVLGVIEVDTLGTTLFHEHLLSSMAAYFEEPTEPEEKKKALEPLTIKNARWARNNRLASLDNAKLNDEEMAIDEALLFKEAGGQTICDVSNIGLGRNPLGLQRIAQTTGLNVIMGSGYYIGASHPPDMDAKTEEEITREIVRDITVGVGDTGVRSGIIGEIGCTIPFQDGEKKVLRAAAKAQQETGAPLMIHPSSRDDVALDNVQILADAGADLNHTVICHVNVYGFSPKTCRALADAGCYIGYESFGNIGYPHIYGEILLQLRSDLHFLDAIVDLIADGYLDHILIAHDICFKDFLTAYGGNGYAHILENTEPVMKILGITEKQIHTLLVDNPKKFLQFSHAN
ncbi:phosphotriesterase [Thermodesulfobacteriota bacterium]